MARRIAYHYHRPGRGETVFHETLCLDRADVKVTLLEQYDGRVVRAGDAVILDPGAPIVWFVFPGAWHDVGRFHRADGTFTGFYTNLCTPVELGPDRWRCTDLFLDLWQPAGGTAGRWLDEDEFAHAVTADLLKPHTADRARQERDAIQARLDAAAWPPPILHTVDLTEARRLAALD